MIVQRCLITGYAPSQFVMYTEVQGDTSRPFLWPFSSGTLVQCPVDTFSRSHGAVKVTFQCWVQREGSKQGPLHRRGHISVTSNRNLACNDHFDELRILVFPLIWTIQCSSWCLVFPFVENALFFTSKLNKSLNCLYLKHNCSIGMRCTVYKGGFF